MRKILFIVIGACIAFAIEFTIFNSIKEWLVPNLLLLFVIFINLSLGIRYSIVAAVIAGILNDCMSATTFGVSICSFVICAYMTTLLKKYVYQVGSSYSRIILVACIVFINMTIQYFLYLMFQSLNMAEVWQFVFFPEMILTLLVANSVFQVLKKCALKYYV